MTPDMSGSPPELSTSRLRLRPVRFEDSAAFFDIFSDVETMRYWSGHPIQSFSEAEEQTREEIKWTQTDTCLTWGMTLPDSDQLIGKFTLFQYSQQNQRAEVGYIMNRRYWGNGYMSETMTCCFNYAFETLQLHRLEADTDPENAGSLALLNKFGFQREGFFADRWNVAGEWKDSVMLGLLKPNYVSPG